jgi:hypothetical protein
VTIAFRHGDTLGDIGYAVLLHSLLSTVAVRLEGGEWGSRFPCIMLKLYRGRLDAADAAAACAEWRDVQAGLAALPPGQVVWDFNDLASRPPWGEALGPGGTSMADYHVTTGGLPLLAVMGDCLAALSASGGMLEIIPFDGLAPFYYVN